MRFSLSHLFDASGRSSRMEFFLHTIFDAVFIIGMFLVASFMSAAFGIEMNGNALAAALLFIILFGGIVEIFATIRRFHDMNMSGWYLLLTMVPLVNFFVGLMLLFKRGDDSSNMYGPPPS